MSNKELSVWLAREIFAIGDDGENRRAVRIQYRTGSLAREYSGGGMIESSLADCLEHLLNRYAKQRAALETEVRCECGAVGAHVKNRDCGPWSAELGHSKHGTL